jgi:hypothetical protein
MSATITTPAATAVGGGAGAAAITSALLQGAVLAEVIGPAVGVLGTAVVVAEAAGTAAAGIPLRPYPGARGDAAAIAG